MIRILIADDHPVVRNGLRGAFANEPDIEVAGEATNGREAVEFAVRCTPTPSSAYGTGPRLSPRRTAAASSHR